MGFGDHIIMETDGRTENNSTQTNFQSERGASLGASRHTDDWLSQFWVLAKYFLGRTRAYEMISLVVIWPPNQPDYIFDCFEEAL